MRTRKTLTRFYGQVGVDFYLRVPSSPPLPARRVGAACDITSMVCCLLCFDDSPVDDDPRAGFQREWEAGLQDAACASPTFCCCGLFCPGPTAYYLRQQVLGGDMRQYTCCQGYFDCCCFQA